MTTRFYNINFMCYLVKVYYKYLSTVIATSVKTPADTVRPAVKLLAVQVAAPKGQCAVTRNTKLGAPFNVAISKSAIAKFTKKQLVTVRMRRCAGKYMLFLFPDSFCPARIFF